MADKENVKVSDYLQDELIFLRADFKTSEDLFKGIDAVAKAKGYVTGDFLPKIIKRESTFPTGLQLEKRGVAIPHTDADTIRKEFVSVIVNNSPICFKRMDDPNEEVNAKVVFVLGLNKPHAQLEMLQALMSIIQDDSLVCGIENAVNNSDVYKFLSN
ncbi:PTS sugar transporter subunit IIA [Lactiplantibacillus pentosus]|uniref:Protein-N(Pi)-phosphohistidine--sugar phosphotransferase n=1 Tax=Lactiplantibacillus plantarum subsp. plantarum TaxID=337330 RepID=A0A2S3U8A6_LACPN|nr:PTS sugar transporter subunit IIA [Lactiplantibacillus pentosus]MCT3276966.1 PTS sugar transporter subunit IIA [Lactiplantibacillus pentosus]MDC6396770.1 PTS sugar transporter subunit IIA [Lactiplantibacillus pentosus]POD87132.1 Protein-N(pi)-phosphohistidine--sugar phosphotransferase [Lactiplantibacillus plantarum subsp. plantarum]